LTFLIDPRSIAPHVQPATYTRGLQLYLTQGVLDHQLLPASAHVWQVDGAVRGSEPQPYDTSVQLEVAENGQIVVFDGSCSCPVGGVCKHAVALALKAAYATVMKGTAAAPTAPAPWPRVAALPAPPPPPAVPRAVTEMRKWLDLFDPEPPAVSGRQASAASGAACCCAATWPPSALRRSDCARWA
jgi:hypothetical protein